MMIIMMMIIKLIKSYVGKQTPFIPVFIILGKLIYLYLCVVVVFVFGEMISG